MRNSIRILIVGLLAGGLLCWQKISHAKKERERAAEAEQRLREAESYAVQQQQALQTKLRQSRLEAASKANEAQELKQQFSGMVKSNTATDAPPGAKLFKDPQMKTLMKKQQMENVERTVKRIVNAQLVQKLGLSAEQATYLAELLKKKYGPGADLTIELMAGELSDPQMAELGRQFKQQIADTDAQIKAWLGDDAYKTFDWQEKSQEERSRVKDFQKKMANTGQALNPEQESQLLLAMCEERQNFPFRVDYRDPLNYDYEHLHEFFGDANFDLFFQDMEQLNQKILQRAQTVLTPEQLIEFETLQQDQLEKGKVVVRMTNALFGKRGAN